MKLTILSDNHAAPGLEAEHGFALWIEAKGRRILFDTGEGAAFWHNVHELGVDIAQAEAIVLSHGHYDHTGNLSAVLGKASKAALYCHPSCVDARYSIRQEPKPVGMPVEGAVTMAAMRHKKRRIVTQPTAITTGVWLSGPVPRQTAFEDTGGPFYLDEQRQQPDLVPDDLSLWVTTPRGLVICLGCCHAGVINTLRYIIKISGKSRIAVVLGGTHLVNADQERLSQTADALAEFDIPELVLCHCTGDPAAAFLAKRLGPRVRQGYAGLTWDLKSPRVR